MLGINTINKCISVLLATQICAAHPADEHEWTFSELLQRFQQFRHLLQRIYYRLYTVEWNVRGVQAEISAQRWTGSALMNDHELW